MFHNGMNKFDAGTHYQQLLRLLQIIKYCVDRIILYHDELSRRAASITQEKIK